ncbi:MAG: ATP-dependent helicase, partial [Planctomycetia bacterium]
MADGLNAAQSDAVATLRGPLLVLAGAGTGKTRVITVRIANLVRHGVVPGRILALTFTNKAAREMRDRTLKLLGKRLENPPWIGTFHSLCVQVLRREIHLLGYSRQFTICDRGDQESLVRKALREAKIDASAIKPSIVLGIISRWKSHGLRPEQAAGEVHGETERLSSLAYAKYQVYLKSAGVLDFDDLLLCTEELFRVHPEALAREQKLWDHLLVDEYQDTSANQFRILKALAAPHRNLCVVGDDDQSIYGWRGAEVKNILQFDREFPGAKVVRLEENYRSCPNILRLANQLIQCNRERHPKELRASRAVYDEPRFARYVDEVAEAEAVVSDLSATAYKEKMPYSAFAILFRTNEQPRLFEKELRAKQIPYLLVGGFSFFDRREVRDVLAYLR